MIDTTSLNSKTIRLRLIEESDADFVLQLRLNPKYNAFLSKVTADLEAQKRWIKNYKIEEEIGQQYYFIIERIIDSKPCGTVRVYDLRYDSFCWGSWILNEDKTISSAIESALLVYDFGFNVLNYNSSHFEVVKGNDAVMSFHKKFGARVIGEDEQHIYFDISKIDVNKIRRKFKL